MENHDTAAPAKAAEPARPGARDYSRLIKTVAFTCGAACMALEMVGVRLLEPYLGSTIYVWGAIIGIFLGSLALGYYLGGMLADRFPRFSTLGTLVFISALWTFAIPPAAIMIGGWASDAFADPRWQAFCASLILYAVPSALLGMVSPFLIRLAARNVSSMGRTAGGLYAISTFGSIVGTFLVSFVLTEYIGSMNITWGTGAVLLLAAVLCWLAERNPGNTALMLIGAVIAFFAWGKAAKADAARAIATGFTRESPDSPARQMENGRHLEMRESAYHLINVFDGQYDYAGRTFLPAGRAARYMVFNDQLESGCILRDGRPEVPAATACGYVRLLTLGTVITRKAPENIAIIGCGGGIGALMFCHDFPGVKRVDVADIDPDVFALAGKYFNYPYPDRADSPVRSHVVDGRQLLRRTPDAAWDYIILDAYTAGGRIPKHLISREFFALANQKMADGGVLVANIISGLDGENGRLLAAVRKTAGAVFRHVYVFPRDPAHSSNVILVASNHPGERLGAAQLWRNFQEINGKLLKQPVEYAVRNTPASQADLSAAPLLTDDFCPTDSMVSRN